MTLDELNAPDWSDRILSLPESEQDDNQAQCTESEAISVLMAEGGSYKLVSARPSFIEMQLAIYLEDRRLFEEAKVKMRKWSGHKQIGPLVRAIDDGECMGRAIEVLRDETLAVVDA